MKILVTGATGFIGQHLVKKLLKEGHQVDILSRNKQRAEKLFGSNVKIYSANITKRSSLRNLPKKYHWIFHLAAAVLYRKPEKRKFYQVNVKGSRNILEFSSTVPRLKKLIYISTVGVYGPIENPPANETWPHYPKNDYEISKEEGEQIAWKFIKKGLPINIVRPALVYGPGDAVSGMFALFRAVVSGRFMIVGRKEVLMHPAYIDNVINGLLLAARSEIVGEDFIIGDKKSLPLSKLAKLVAKEGGAKLLPFYLPYGIGKGAGIIGDLLNAIGVNFPLASSTVNFMTHHRAYSIKKAENLLSYRPKKSTKEGIKETIEWLKKKKII